MTPMERPDGVADLVVPHDKEAALIEKIRPKIGEVFDPEFSYAGFTDNLLEINGELRSSLLVEPADGKPVQFVALGDNSDLRAPE